MREGLDTTKLQAFIQEIGKAARGPGRVYLVGGATALLLGIRDQTIDIDIKLDPEPQGIFEAIAVLKERLGLNVELASPDQFIPALPGWQGRSEYVTTVGEVEFYHYDFYGQALAKILRGHGNDLSDALALVELAKVDLIKLKSLFQEIQPQLIRYPAVTPQHFRDRVEMFMQEISSHEK